MATIDLDASYGLTDKRYARGDNTGDSPLSAAIEPNLLDQVALDTYLLANGYTAVTLSRMTKNDKIYAVRLKQDAPGTFRG